MNAILLSFGQRCTQGLKPSPRGVWKYSGDLIDENRSYRITLFTSDPILYFHLNSYTKANLDDYNFYFCRHGIAHWRPQVTYQMIFYMDIQFQNLHSSQHSKRGSMTVALMTADIKP
jgi:hypothetical protein